MRIFWCETGPWLKRPSVVRRFCEYAGVSTGDFIRHEDLVPHAAGRFLLLMGARQYLPDGAAPPVQSLPGGKPRFAGGKPAFSISHSGDMAVCAFSNTEVGIDIEKVSDVDPELLAVLRPEELAYLRRFPEDHQARVFFRLWTQKESLVKANGAGLGAVLQLESVITPALCRKDRLNGFALRRLDFWEPDYAAAVSMREEEPVEISCLLLPDDEDQLSEALNSEML